MRVCAGAVRHVHRGNDSLVGNVALRLDEEGSVAAGLERRAEALRSATPTRGVLLADGVSPAYVQEQLGHASIELTVGTYGRWLRKKGPGAVDRLDSRGEVVAERPEVVAAAAGDGPSAPSANGRKSLRLSKLAKREGFEPSVAGSPPHVFSNPSPPSPDPTPYGLSCCDLETDF